MAKTAVRKGNPADREVANRFAITVASLKRVIHRDRVSRRALAV